MHIKQVIISGFRSFRSQSEIEPFSPKHNVIVGRNGSGKSNFFDAIQFVLLAPKFATLRQEDRQHLLHEGAGSSVMAAYVEIIFDNSDGRLSVESDEVVLRRTVGHKKDEFFLNRKRIQKSEVISLLESAGFSKSNPYYIVQQGKVANLCVMKDKDRLNLLKEVAGTTVYEERRVESLKIMEETLKKQEQITEVLTFIEDRLSELEKEKQELSEYEQLDKHRRALEYTIYDKELSRASEQLGQMEVLREESRENQQKLHARIREVQDHLQVEEDSQATARSALDRLAEKRQGKANDVAELIAKKSAIEVELQEVEAAVSAQATEGASVRRQLEEVNALVAQTEAELEQKGPEFEQRTDRLKAAQQELDQLKARVEALMGKQGRGRQFGSKSERDAFLQKQIDSLEKQVGGKRTLLDRTMKEIDAEVVRIQREGEQLARAQGENQTKSTRYEELAASIQEKTRLRNDRHEQKKNCWREVEAFREKLNEAKQELERGNQQLNGTLPRTITQGLATVERIAEEHNLPGYYGPLIDNFKLKSDALRTAVEVAAGNSLFHVVVDTDATAAYLMKELEKRKAGRLTFLPLNRLRNPDVKYPDSPDVHSLIAVALDYNPDFEQAMRQVFGKKLLTRELDTAAHFSKEYQLDVITWAGDQANRRGGFEGGYHDERVSRIGAVMKIREAKAKLDELGKQEVQLKRRSDEAEAAENEVVLELQKIESEREHYRANAERLTKELRSRDAQLSAAQKGIDARKEGLSVIDREVAATQGQIEQFKQEQKSPLNDKLTEAERRELKALNERERPLQEDVQGLEREVMTVTEERKKLQADLKGNLLKRKDELTAKLAIGGGRSGSGARDMVNEAEVKRMERQHILSQVEASEKELELLEGQVDKKRVEVAKIDKQVESLHAQEVEAQEEMNEAAKMQDKMLNKRSMLMETVSQKQHMIRELGTLPRKELEEFRTLSEKPLMKKLKEVNDGLKKYASVNRKALDQYISFNEQRENLVNRREELARDSSSIEQMVANLDNQKEEAILRTFRGVSHHFSEVFAELVPGGDGHLIMRTTADEAAEGNVDAEGQELTTEAEEPTQASSSASATASASASGASSKGKNKIPPVSISSFQGVQVRVTFSATGQMFDMMQLSGGQKALVALALIFAIQRCDPAPFYLFDEIDQALDANYRSGVARLIQKQVNSEDAPAQFITTTFRPELVEVCNKCYGIALMNKVSNIYPLDKSDAQNFVTNLMNEEEAVGQVSTVPAFNRVQRQQQQQEEDEERDDDAHTQRGRTSQSSAGAAGAGVGAAGRGGRGRRRGRDEANIDEEEEEEEEEAEEGEEEGGVEGEDDDEGLQEMDEIDEEFSKHLAVAGGDEEGEERSSKGGRRGSGRSGRGAAGESKSARGSSTRQR